MFLNTTISSQKKTPGLISILTLLSLVISGCAGDVRQEPEAASSISDSVSAEAEPSEAESPSEPEHVTLIVDNPLLTNQNRVTDINDYLKKTGAEYRIAMWKQTASDPPRSYAVKNGIEKGDYPDIVFGGDQTINGHTAFNDLYEAGLLECLESYMDSDKGKELYSAIPSVIWEGARLQTDGSLYGITGDPYCIRSNPVYYVNYDLMLKYDISEEDLCRPLGELREILAEVQKGENKEGKAFYAVKLFLTGISSTDEIEFNPKLPGITVSMSDGDAKVKYILNDEKRLSYLRDIYDIAHDPKLCVTTDNSVDYDSFFLLFDGAGNTGVYDDSIMGYTSYKHYNDGILLYPYGDDLLAYPKVGYSSILSCSDHKDEAFDFLYRLYTDPELSQIAVFGTQVAMEGGYLYALDGTVIRHFIYRTWGNGFITPPVTGELASKKVLKSVVSSASVNPLCGFHFNDSTVSNYKAGVGLINNLKNYLSYPSFESFLDEQKELYDKYNCDELIAAIQAELDEYVK